MTKQEMINEIDDAIGLTEEEYYQLHEMTADGVARLHSQYTVVEA